MRLARNGTNLTSLSATRDFHHSIHFVSANRGARVRPKVRQIGVNLDKSEVLLDFLYILTGRKCYDYERNK